MSLLLACAEDCDLETYVGSISWTTTAGQFRSGYARGALRVTGTGQGLDPPSSYFRTLAFSSAASEFWVGFRMASSGGATATSQWVRILDSSDVCRLIIRPASSSTVALAKRTAAGTITDLATSGAWAAPVSLTSCAIYVKYANDGTGVFTLYQDGLQVVTYSGANTTDGATQLAKLEFGQATSNSSASYSEIMASTDSTLGKGLVLLNSTTAGNAQDWTGTASNVNQNSLTNDGQYIYSDTANEIQQYKPAALPAGDFAVDAVVMSARAVRGAAGPQNMQFATRIATTDYFSSSSQPALAFANLQNIQATNPATASAWAAADLADTNFQYGVKSIT